MVRRNLLHVAMMMVLIAGVAMIAPATAQQPTSAPQSDRQPPPSNDPFNPQHVPWFSFSFPGGPVEKYVQVLRETLRTNNKDANVILREGAGGVPVPAVSLQNVTIEAALQILHDHIDEERDVRLNLDVVHAGGSPIFILTAMPMHKLPPHEEMVHVWNVRQLLTNDVKAEDMLTAIETSLTLLRSEHEPAEVRFHEATGLVMARGTKEQVSTIELVIAELRETSIHVEMDRQRRMELEQAEAARADSSARLEHELVTARQELGNFKQERDSMFLELQAMHQHREAMQQEHERAMQRMQELEQELAKRARQPQGNP